MYANWILGEKPYIRIVLLGGNNWDTGPSGAFGCALKVRQERFLMCCIKILISSSTHDMELCELNFGQNFLREKIVIWGKTVVEKDPKWCVGKWVRTLGKRDFLFAQIFGLQQYPQYGCMHMWACIFLLFYFFFLFDSVAWEIDCFIVLLSCLSMAFLLIKIRFVLSYFPGNIQWAVQNVRSWEAFIHSQERKNKCGNVCWFTRYGTC